MAENSSTSQSTYTTPFITEMTIPPSLKFFMNNFKAMATTPLTSENYHLWSSQILKLFKAVNLDGFLHGTTPCPPQTLLDPAGSSSPNPHYLPTETAHSPNLTQQAPPQEISTLPCLSPISATEPDAPPITVTSTHPMTTRLKSGISLPKKVFDLHHPISPPIDPTTYKQAANQTHWIDAMNDEIDALYRQGTWTLVPPPPNANILGCRWTYKMKFHSDGSLARHKARLVAQGFNQAFGIDYHKTFSPVAKITTIRILLTIAAHHAWDVLQLDVSNAFLHGTLDDKIYMLQPVGFVNEQHPTHVCLLHKALYGLK